MYINKQHFFYWHGGKFHLADKFISLFPDHVSYIEVFGGSGTILLSKPRSYIEVFNDIDSHVYNLFKQIRLYPDEFIKQIKMVPFSREQYDEFVKDINDEKDEFQKAIMAYTIFNQRNILNNEWGLLRKNSSVRSTYLTARIEKLSGIISRLMGVGLENESFEFILKRYDEESAFFYLDPPYIPETRKTQDIYNHEMSYEDHEYLVSILRNIEGKVMLSGYANELYDTLNWNKTSFFTTVRAKNKKKNGDYKREEFIWTNYDFENRQLRLF